MLDRAVYEQYWHDDSVNVFRVYLDAGHRSAGGEAADPRALSPDHPRLFVLTNAEVRSYVLKLTDQWFRLTYSQIFIAVLVAILGIVNTLTVSITDRKRELGVLRAVGGFRRQIRQTIWMEAVAIGAGRPGARIAVRRRELVLPAADHRTRSVRDASAVSIPVQHRG